MTQPRRGAHVYSWELANGPVPAGMTIDHLCHTPESCAGGPACQHRRCVNPAHLTLATYRDNALRGSSPAAINARKTHCPRGHPLSGDNLFVNVRGARVCRACRA